MAISADEFLETLTILEVTSECIKDPAKVRNIHSGLQIGKAIWSETNGKMAIHTGLRDQLRISTRSSGTRNHARTLTGQSISFHPQSISRMTSRQRTNERSGQSVGVA